MTSDSIAPMRISGNPLALSKETRADLHNVAQAVFKSGLAPKSIKTIDQCFVTILTGTELGLSPIEALRSVHVIDGKPSLAVELMLDRAIKLVAGFKYAVRKSTDTTVVVAMTRESMLEPFVVTWTLEMAKRAGLTGKSNWKNYPEAMLRWRALGDALRVVAPEVMRGCVTQYEAMDMREAEVIVRDAKPTDSFGSEPTLPGLDDDAQEAETATEPVGEALDETGDFGIQEDATTAPENGASAPSADEMARLTMEAVNHRPEDFRKMALSELRKRNLNLRTVQRDGDAATVDDIFEFRAAIGLEAAP